MSIDFHPDIPVPCEQSWNGMQSGEGGRYCGACSTIVIDFTKMTDPQILHFLSTAGRPVCGRLRSDQCQGQRPSGARPVKRSWVAWSWLLAGVFLIFRVSAQQPVRSGLRAQGAPSGPETAGRIVTDTLPSGQASVKIRLQDSLRPRYVMGKMMKASADTSRSKPNVKIKLRE